MDQSLPSFLPEEQVSIGRPTQLLANPRKVINPNDLVRNKVSPTMPLSGTDFYAMVILSGPLPSSDVGARRPIVILGDRITSDALGSGRTTLPRVDIWPIASSLLKFELKRVLNPRVEAPPISFDSLRAFGEFMTAELACVGKTPDGYFNGVIGLSGHPFFTFQIYPVPGDSMTLFCIL